MLALHIPQKHSRYVTWPEWISNQVKHHLNLWNFSCDYLPRYSCLLSWCFDCETSQKSEVARNDMLPKFFQSYILILCITKNKTWNFVLIWLIFDWERAISLKNVLLKTLRLSPTLKTYIYCARKSPHKVLFARPDGDPYQEKIWAKFFSLN